MNDLLNHLKLLSEHLEELQRPWAIVGALACNEYVEEPRFTSDIDIAIAIGENDNSFLSELSNLGYVLLETSIHPEKEFVTSARLLGLDSEFGRFFIDILLNSTGIENEITSRASKKEILPNLVIPIASLGCLIAMKTLAIISPERIIEKVMNDEADMIALLRTAKKEDLEEAKEIAELINKNYSIEIPNVETKLKELIRKYKS